MRRRKAEKREILPDPVYDSTMVEKFINCFMKHGKKMLARRIVYSALEQFSKKVGEQSPIKAFEKAVHHVKPHLQVKSRRVGGATYQIPMEVEPDRQLTLAFRWILMNSRKKSGRSMLESLTSELVDCYNKQGATIKKKEETHRMAEANRAFAHFKF